MKQSLAAYVFHDRTKSLCAVPPHKVNKGHVGAPGGLFSKFGVSSHPTLLPYQHHPSSWPQSPPSQTRRTVSPRLLPLAHSFAGEVWSQVYHHPQPASSLGVRKALPFLTKFQATARREGASHLPFILDKASEVLSTEPEGAPCFLFLQCCLWKVFFLVLPPLSRPLVSKDYSIRGKNLG